MQPGPLVQPTTASTSHGARFALPARHACARRSLLRPFVVRFLREHDNGRSFTPLHASHASHASQPFFTLMPACSSGWTCDLGRLSFGCLEFGLISMTEHTREKSSPAVRSSLIRLLRSQMTDVPTPPLQEHMTQHAHPLPCIASLLPPAGKMDRRVVLGLFFSPACLPVAQSCRPRRSTTTRLR